MNLFMNTLHLDIQIIHPHWIVFNVAGGIKQHTEESRNKLKFRGNQLKSMAGNTENENGNMIRLVDQPHETVLKSVTLEDKSVSRSKVFLTYRRELLDKPDYLIAQRPFRLWINWS
jgi:hypothetical protein